MVAQKQGLAPTDEECRREFVNLYVRPKNAEDYDEEYAKIVERKYKRINDTLAKKHLENKHMTGYDRDIKDLCKTPDRTHIPLERTPESILYEQTNICLPALSPTWRCEKCGTQHHKAVPEFWDSFENRVRMGCSFCHTLHPFDQIDFKRI